MAGKDKCWKIDLEEIQQVLIEVAKRAGEMITSAKPVIQGSGTKLNSADLVTETDQAVEKMVSTTLKVSKLCPPFVPGEIDHMSLVFGLTPGCLL